MSSIKLSNPKRNNSNKRNQVGLITMLDIHRNL